MGIRPASSTEKGRRDHYVPQGYLRGFIAPERRLLQKPLWVLDVTTDRWSERSPSQVAWSSGYYDYAGSSRPDATADEAFAPFERRFPQIRERIRSRGYNSWIQDREFLVGFAAMMAARSPLFRSQAALQVSSSIGDDPTRDGLSKNFSITLMRSEMSRRAQAWSQFHWVLASTDPEHPFVTSDQTVGMRGDAPTQIDALARNDFWIWCPLAWDMCLVASSLPLTTAGAAKLKPEHVAEIQALTVRQAKTFVASPCQLGALSRSG